MFGKENAKRTPKCDREENGIRITGYVCEPDLCRSNRSMENFFINGRYIKSKTAAAALEQAYASKIPADKFPFCVLNIELNPAAVDVNVHPAKLEVKFANEKLIFDAVYYAVLSALEADAIRPEFTLPAAKNQPYVSPAAQNTLKNAFVPLDQRGRRSQQVRLGDIPESPAPDKPKEEAEESTVSPLQNLIRAVRDAQEHPAVPDNVPEMPPIPDEPPEMQTIPDEIPEMPPIPDTPPEEKPLPVRPPVSPIRQEVSAPVRPAPVHQTSVPVQPASRETIADPNPEPAPEPVKTAQAGPVYIPDEIRPGDIPEYTIIGEAFNCYVIVQIADRILMIDKHAAHERIIFDELSRKMRSNLKNGTKTGQMVLVPLNITVLPAEADVLEEYRDKVEALGFAFTCEKTAAAAFTVSISQIPEQLDNAAALELFSTLASRLSARTASVESAAEGFFETRLWQSACKAAMKGGRIYDMGHIKWICDRLLKKPDKDNQVIRTCPHGRPVAFEIKKSSIDRQFARLG